MSTNLLFRSFYTPVRVRQIAWSPPQGKCLAVVGSDGRTRVLEARSGEQLFERGRGEVTLRVHCVSFSPDGARLAGGYDDGIIRIWDASSGHDIALWEWHSAPVTSVAWSPDGARVASTSEDLSVRVWDAATGGEVFTYDEPERAGYTASWSPEGARLACACASAVGKGSLLRVWDIPSGRMLSSLPLDSPVDLAEWSPDGARIAFWGRHLPVSLWDPRSHRVDSFFPGESAQECVCLVWSPDGTALATAEPGAVRVWGVWQDGAPSLLSQEVFADRDGGRLGIGALAWSPPYAVGTPSGVLAVGVSEHLYYVRPPSRDS